VLKVKRDGGFVKVLGHAIGDNSHVSRYLRVDAS
jgi:hypothetical protein